MKSPNIKWQEGHKVMAGSTSFSQSPDLQSATELPITGFDAVEFYVGNAKQAAYFYHAAFGFDIAAYKGPETGCKDHCSYYLKQNNIKLILSGGLSDEHPITQHVKIHGDGVKDVGFVVDNATVAFEQAVARGARPVMPPVTSSDTYGSLTKATIATFGETTHTFYERHQFSGAFEPGLKSLTIKDNPLV